MSEFRKRISEYYVYLDDIRQRVYNSVIFFLIFFIIGFFSANPILRLGINYFKIKNVTITATSPFQIVSLAMDIGLFVAIIGVTPIILYQIYSFLRSGLMKNERKIFIKLIPLSIFLFIFGFFYGFFTLYYALQMMAQINIGLGIINLWDISLFLSQIVLTSALLGLIFQFPIIMTFLVKLGVLKIDFLKTKRRHAIVIIVIFVSLLPPTDGISLLVMALPLVAIYELTIFTNSFRLAK